MDCVDFFSESETGFTVNPQLCQCWAVCHCD